MKTFLLLTIDERGYFLSVCTRVIHERERKEVKTREEKSEKSFESAVTIRKRKQYVKYL